MKMRYDPEVDALYITINPKGKYFESKEIGENIIVDFSQKGEIIGIEILNFKKGLEKLGNVKLLINSVKTK